MYSRAEIISDIENPYLSGKKYRRLLARYTLEVLLDIREHLLRDEENYTLNLSKEQTEQMVRAFSEAQKTEPLHEP